MVMAGYYVVVGYGKKQGGEEQNDEQEVPGDVCSNRIGVCASSSI